MVRVVCETEVPSPGTATRPARKELSGDLDTIVLKALRKESPARRYADAGAMADDIRRFLEDQPVHARPKHRRGIVRGGSRDATGAV